MNIPTNTTPDKIDLQLAQFYASTGNWYNAVHYYELAINGGDTGLESEMGTASQQLQQQAKNDMKAGNFSQANAEYQLLSTSSAVPSDIQADAAQSLSSSQNMGFAWFYYGQNNLYNAVYYLNEEAKGGNGSTGLVGLMEFVATKLQERAQNETQAGDFNGAYTEYQLLATSDGVPASIKQDAADSMATSENLGQARYYLDQSNWYNAVYYLALEMQSNDSTGVSAMMEYAAAKLQQQAQSATASQGSFTQSYGAYDLLANTANVPVSIKQDASKSIDVSDSDYGNALWYLNQSDYANAKYYLQQVAAKGNDSTGVNALLTYVNGK